MPRGRRQGSKGSVRSSSSKQLTASHEQVEQRTQDSLPLEIHAIATPLSGSHVEDHSRHTVATQETSNSPEELCGSQWSSRLKAAFHLPHNMRVELISPMDRDTSGAQRAAKENPVSALMNSFWSMLAPHSGFLLPKGWRPMTPSDLACAVATILTLGIMVLALLLLFFSNDDPKRAQVTVSGAFGSVTGIGKLTAGRHVYVFLGVPFGEPPLRGARFRKAAPRQPDAFDGRQPGPACFQEGEEGNVRPGVSEDCLHLNIWTPQALCGDASCAKRTVLFFLHGGLFQSGSNSDDPLDGSYLSALGDVVVVVPNYRLGALGFLYSGGPEAPGNAGLHDQLLALEWTRAHIGSFAGNGSDVVIMGHGAGAGSIGLHLFGQPQRLTTRAILMSGSPFARMRDNTANHRTNLEWLAHRMNCGSEGVASCLRNTDAESLYLPDNSLAVPRFSPTFSGLLPGSPFKLRHFVRVTGVNVLLGHVEDEAPSMLSYLRSKGIIQGEWLNSFAPTLLSELGFSSDSSIVVAHYYMNGSAGNASHWAGDLLMDVLVVCPVRHFADYLDEAGNNSVHRYLLLKRRRPSSGNASTAGRGAPSSGDEGGDSAPRLYALGLVFGEPLRSPNGDAEEQALSRRMIALWTEFAKRGTIPADVGESIFNYTIAISSPPKTDGSPFQFRKNQCDFLKSHYL